jgi:hypothetical protein
MKKLFLLGCLLMSVSTILQAKKVYVNVSFEIGRPKFNCDRGVWICNWDGDVKVELPKAEGIYETTDGTFTLKFHSELSKEAIATGFFYAESGESVPLPSSVLNQIGKRIRIVPDKYKIDFSASKFGTVSFKTEEY